MTIENLTDEGFKELGSVKICVVKFGAVWCQPCKMIGPMLESISRQLPEHVRFFSVDIDVCKNAVKSMSLRKVPTVSVMKSGVEVARKEGLVSESDLLAMVQIHL